jgi:hypothetical protein
LGFRNRFIIQWSYPNSIQILILILKKRFYFSFNFDEDVLTNAHLFRPFLPDKFFSSTSNPYSIPTLKQGVYPMIRIGDKARSSFQWKKAEIMFVSRSKIDVALLRLCDVETLDTKLLLQTLQPIQIRDTKLKPLQLGEFVVVLGHGVFPPSKEMLASCTTGQLSRIVSIRDQPVILQTTAAVHAGNSGGLLLDRLTKFSKPHQQQQQ